MNKKILFPIFLLILLVISTNVNSQNSVIWTNKKNVTVKNGYISKFSGGLLWDAGATSKRRLPKDRNGSVEAIIQKTKQSKILGLAKPGKINDWEVMDYGIAIKAGKISIVEAGNTVFETKEKCKKGDIITIDKKYNRISYQLNGKTLFASTKEVSTSLRVQAAFFSAGVGYYKVKTKGFLSATTNIKKGKPVALKPGPVLMKADFSFHGDNIEISGMNLTTLEAINKIEDKEERVVTLNLKKITQVDFYRVFDNLPWTRKLAINPSDKNKITTLSPIKKLTQLETIYFDNGFSKPDQKIDLELIAGLKNLKEVSIHNFTIFSNYEILQTLPKLETLKLGGADKNQLDFLASLKSLKKLNLWVSGGDFTDISILGKLTSLRELDISQDQEIKDLSPLYNLKNLEEIKISTACPDSEIKKLREALPNLRGVLRF